MKSRCNPIQPLIKFLQDNPDIKLILSDKNLGLVAIDLLKYHNIVLENLQKEQYEEIETKKDLFFSTHGTKTKQQFDLIMKNLLGQCKETYLIKYLKYYQSYTKFSTPKFHILLKIHKGLTKLQSRPIVGAVNWYTTPVSKILSKNLRHLFDTFFDTRHLANNTFDIVQSIGNFNLFHFKSTSNYILVSLDVKDLYTNIDLTILYDILNEINPEYTRMAKFICNHNYFEYGDTIYRQTNGIAMGTNSAPELANLYLLALVDPWLMNQDNIPFFKRYLDDIFFIWNSDIQSLNTFLTLLHNVSADAKLTLSQEISRYETIFLDLCIILTPSGLEHYTHQKKLNKYGYISPKSCHPKHTLSGFIKGELTRYGLNSSRKYYYQITKTRFFHRLLARGYQRTFLNRIFQAHGYKNWLRTKPKPNPNSTNLSLRYSSRLNIRNLTKTLRKVGTVLSRRILPGHELQFSWKRSRNLLSQVCKSSLTIKQLTLVKHATIPRPFHKPLFNSQK